MEKNIFPKLRIFSSDEIDKKFQSVLDLCNNETEYEKIIQIISKTFYNRLIPTLTFNENSPKLTVYRVTRPYDGLDPNNFKSFSYPPNPGLGRANLAGYPVFYCSFNPAAALREMKEVLYLNEHLFISEWQVTFKKPVIAYMLLINTITSMEEVFPKKLVDKQLEAMLNMLKKPTSNMTEGLKQYLIKIGDLFALPKSDHYKITSALAHEVLYTIKNQNANVSMLFYPAIESRHNGLNFAIHPDLVNSEMMQCLKVFKLKVTKVDGMKGLTTSINECGFVAEDQSIDWHRPFSKIEFIDYDNVIIHNHNNSVITGVEALNKQIINSAETIGSYLRRVYPNNILDILPQLCLDDFSNTDNVRRQETLGVEFPNGIIQIETEQGSTCVKRILIPVKWIDGYNQNAPIQ